MWLQAAPNFVRPRGELGGEVYNSGTAVSNAIVADSGTSSRDGDGTFISTGTNLESGNSSRGFQPGM